MPLALRIALQHLRHRQRQTLVSLLGVALGVAFFIAIATMMQGFQRDFVARIIDVQPHVIVKDEFRDPPRQPVERVYPAGTAIELRSLKPRDEVRGIRGARNMLAVLEEEKGIHVAPTLSGNILLRFGGKDVSANITGIDPQRQRRVTHLEEDLVEGGSLDALYTTANGIILGEGVAKRGGIRMGDLISVVSPEGVMMKMKVVGLFSSGITLMDNFDTYVLLKKAQVLENRPNVINRVNLRLDDVERAADVAARIERQFGYRAEPWQEQSRNVLGIFVIQNVIMYSTVSAILIVACFGIFNVISTVVFEKTRDIGILKSMGFRDAHIRRIFIAEGLMVGVLGTLIGWALGYGIVEFMSTVKFQMEGFVKSQGFILYRTPMHYLISGGMAILSATVAAWVPARRASRLNPVDIVRGSG